MKRRIVSIALCLALVLPGILIPTLTSAEPTTSVTITKYASDGTTIITQATKTPAELETELPVSGDGATHYWMQGPTFYAENLWDPAETLNLKDKGAVQGSLIKDLCELVGGASVGDRIEIKAVDDLAHEYRYESIYDPGSAMGSMVLCWKKDGGYAGADFSEGMQLVFFAPTANGSGIFVFGNQDMHDYLPEDNWHYFFHDGVFYPSVNGLSIKWVDEINIYTSGTTSSQSSASLSATANVVLPIVGIELNVDSVDYGDLMPGQKSGTETVVLNNTGTVDCSVTLEIRGEDTTAQNFYKQSLFVNGSQYNINDILASVTVNNSRALNTQLRVPDSWNEGGEQKATFIFWAEAQ